MHKLMLLLLILSCLTISATDRSVQNKSNATQSVFRHSVEAPKLVDLMRDRDLFRLTRCDGACEVILNGAYQTMLISIDDSGFVTEKPVIIDRVVESPGNMPFQLNLEPGFHPLKIGEYLYGIFVLTDHSMVFTSSRGSESDARNSAVKSNRNQSYIDGPGETPDPSNPCPTQMRLVASGCETLPDGGIGIWAVYYKFDCNNVLISIIVFEMTIPAEMAHLVYCNPNP